MAVAGREPGEPPVDPLSLLHAATRQALLTPLGEIPLAGGGDHGSVAGAVSPAPQLRIGPDTIPPRLSLAEALRLFQADMRRRGCRELSIGHFRRYTENCIAHAGWVYVDDIALAGAVDYLSAKRAGGWSGTTHDQAVSALRCFGRFVAALGHTPGNQLANLATSGEQGEPGARAMTAAEVRRIIAVAYAAQTSGDRRNEKSCRALVYTFAALTGLRHAECKAIRWSDIDLGPTPYIVCAPSWQKNGRRQTVAMNPEIAHLLRWHRDTMPHEPNDRIFPTFPHRPTFRRDRDDAGIPERDGRGRLASYHSFRKFFDTELDRLSTPTGVRLALMRHSGGLDGRYLDHPDEAQVLAVGQLPRLWPIPPSGADQKNRESSGSPSCKWGRNGDTTRAVSDATNQSLTASSSPASPQGEGHGNFSVRSARRGTGGRHDSTVVRKCPSTAQSEAEQTGWPDPNQGTGYDHENQAGLGGRDLRPLRRDVHAEQAVEVTTSLSPHGGPEASSPSYSPAPTGSVGLHAPAQPHADQRGTPRAGPFARVAPADDDRQPGLSPIDMLTPNERRAWAEFFRRLLGAALLAGAGLAMAASVARPTPAPDTQMAAPGW